jgi:hypothetical protein
LGATVQGIVPGRALLAAGAALVLGACVEPDPDRSLEGGAPPGPRVADLVIDSGGQAQLEPGSGIGVAISYTEGGRWSLTTACDTSLTGLFCDYDIIVSTDEASPITAFEGSGLEPDDDVQSPDDFAVTARFTTAEDTDGLGFSTSPGATVRVSALLYDPSFDSGFDWIDDPRFLSWVGDGAVHHGAPTNPVDLTPDRP